MRSDYDMVSCETDYEMVNEMTQKQYDLSHNLPSHLTLMTRDGVYKTSIKKAGMRATISDGMVTCARDQVMI